ncbi:MAG: AAA family ATPase [Gammaproteobacteria bacterium]|nr:AAA family ATPase [Gammaproteobacteria bacterium]
MDDQARLIESLRRADAYPHLAANIEVIETHISWVVLTGIFAYKIKKALTLDFLDFGSLAKRKQFCEEELRLNRRWAPDLYLDVVPICGSAERPSFGGGGPVIEYALKLRQFPQQAQLDRQLDAGLLFEQDMVDLAETVASLHNTAKRIDYVTSEKSVALVEAPMLDNFPFLEKATDMALLERVHDWTVRGIAELEELLVERQRSGFVRECHGDLHLANLVRLSSGIVPFDCIEFSEDLRNLDVINDIAFLSMDLVARARQDLATIFVNHYLERTGDYAGMRTFGLYFVYHCLVRAKVAAIRSGEREGRARDDDIDAMKHYLAVAARWIDRRKPVLIAMHGLSGSGKTWLSSKLLSRLPAIRVRSDIERRRVFGMDESEHSESAPGEGIYAEQAKGRVYRRLFELAGTLLQTGFNVIIDASFLQRAPRDEVRAFAESNSCALVFVETIAREKTLVERVKQRKASGVDASEAGAAVLAYQQTQIEPLTPAERQRTVTVAADEAANLDKLIKKIHKRTSL